MSDIQAFLGKVVDYAERYDSEFLSSMGKVSQLVGYRSNFDSVTSVGQAWLQDSMLALISALWYSCARQGVPERYWQLAAQAVKETLAREGHYRETRPQEVWKQLEQLCWHPVDCFKTGDQRRNPSGPASKGTAVKDSACLHLNHDNLMYNIRNWLASNAKQTHFAVRANVRGMGDKTTGLLLRDVAWVYDLEGQGSLAHTSQAIYIQPVDIWVRRVAEYLWPDLKGERNWKVVAYRIVVECRQAKVSAIRFNQGACYFGARIVKTANRLCSELAVLNE